MKNPNYFELIEAVRSRNTELTDELLAAGVGVDSVDKNGITALMVAAESKNNEIVTLLLEYGADPNLQDKDGETALMRAEGYKIIRLLVEAGADVNLRNKENKTALMFRAKSGYPDRVKKLILAGANPTLKDNLGQTALDYAPSFETEKVNILKEAINAWERPKNAPDGKS